MEVRTSQKSFEWSIPWGGGGGAFGDAGPCSWGMPLHSVHTECDIFVLSHVRGLYLKPHSALGINQRHGLLADERFSREDDNHDEFCFGVFPVCPRGMGVFMGL